MNINVFNQTSEDISPLNEELKNLLIAIANDEKIVNPLFNVILVDDNEIREINRTYRNIDKATDVISFALEDDQTFNCKDVRVLGDIYISLDTAKRQAFQYEHSFKRELFFLATHGFFHLLGYDHLNDKDEKIMFDKQEEVLNKYGIKREKE